MPYTFAHIGYVLPLKKKWGKHLSMTGLAFGSITPDYDFLFRLTNISDHLFQYDLKCILIIIYPISLISALFFHLICRNIIIDHLPVYFHENFKRRSASKTFIYFKKQFLNISFSIILAILIHLILDFFGHIDKPLAIKLYLLNKTNSITLGKISYLLACYLLPVLFSLFGFYLVYVYFLNKTLTLNMFNLTSANIKFWFSIAFVTVLLSILKYQYTEQGSLYIFDIIAIITTASFIISTYIVCFCYQLFNLAES